ncbi:hypothetical protein Tco_0407315 [Tanacetum coccineum]
MSIADSGWLKAHDRNLKLLTNFCGEISGNDEVWLGSNAQTILGYEIWIWKLPFQKSYSQSSDLKGNDLLIGSRGTDLYSITLQTHISNPLLNGKATSSKHDAKCQQSSFVLLAKAIVNKMGENLDKMKEKVMHVSLLVFYSVKVLQGDLTREHRIIVETIQLNFDELPSDGVRSCHSDPVSTNFRQRSTTPLEHSSTHQNSNSMYQLSLPLSLQPKNINSKQKPKLKMHTIYEELIYQHLSTPVQEQGETSSRHVDSSNMHTSINTNLSQPFDKRPSTRTKSLRNPSKSIRIRRHLETECEML